MSAELDENSETWSMLRPLARRDLGAWPLYRGSDHRWCVGSVEVDRYVAMPQQFCPAVLTMAALLDGTNTLDRVSHEIKRIYPGITHAHIHRFYEILSKSDLILFPRPTFVYRSEMRQLSLDVVSLNISGLTQVLASVLKTPLWWLLNIIGLVIIAFAVCSIVRNSFATTAQLLLVGHSYALGLLVSLVLTGLVVLWHEVGHGIIAVRYGLHPHKLRLALYVGIVPLVYLNVPGLYTISRWKRIAVWLGGVWANLCGAAALILLATHITLPVLVQQILWKLCLVNLMFIPANLSPFMPTDGYFIFCNLVGQFNLRSRLWQELKGGWLRQEQRPVRSLWVRYMTWLYAGISIAFLIAGGIFWAWWIWHICLEIFLAVSGPLPLRWGTALLPPAALTLGLTFLIVQKRRTIHKQVKQASSAPSQYLKPAFDDTAQNCVDIPRLHSRDIQLSYSASTQEASARNSTERGRPTNRSRKSHPKGLVKVHLKRLD